MLTRDPFQTTFDIIGDLAFGEPFGCLETSQNHGWIKLIFGLASWAFYLLNLCASASFWGIWSFKITSVWSIFIFRSYILILLLKTMSFHLAILALWHYFSATQDSSKLWRTRYISPRLVQTAKRAQEFKGAKGSNYLVLSIPKLNWQQVPWCLTDGHKWIFGLTWRFGENEGFRFETTTIDWLSETENIKRPEDLRSCSELILKVSNRSMQKVYSQRSTSHARLKRW